MQQLETKLREIANREASIRQEAYEMLEIVTNVVGELEDAGDRWSAVSGAATGGCGGSAEGRRGADENRESAHRQAAGRHTTADIACAGGSAR